jgi:GntR family transcriptional regulator
MTRAGLSPVRQKLRYEQVIELVERLIADRDLRPGSQLPTNEELARMADVSLITVRRALSELERAGRVVRHQGVGTFVAGERIVSQPSRTGDLLATLSAENGPELSTRLLDIKEGTPNPTVAALLQIDPGERVWLVSRLRLIGGAPKILEDAILPLSRVPELDWPLLASGRSLYRFLADRYGLTDAYEEQYLEVAEPDEREREFLRLPRGRPIVRLRGVTFDERGGPYDCFRQVYPADEFVFYISGSTARRVVQSPNVRDWSVE